MYKNSADAERQGYAIEQQGYKKKPKPSRRDTQVMNETTHGGKGSKRRHGNEEAYQSNWDRIFGGIDYSSLREDMLDKDVGGEEGKDEEKDEVLYHFKDEGSGLQHFQHIADSEPVYSITPKPKNITASNNNQ